jgi:hypothetical protein
VKLFLKGWMLFCILFPAIFASAQNANTSLRGVIKDPNGALVPGAKITLTNNADGQTLSAVANSGGEYAFAQISPARYKILVQAIGFGEQIKTAELLVNQPATVDFTLTVQSSTVTVDVSALAETLNTSDASLGNAVGNELIQSLPSETRNVPDLLSLQPGVLYLPNMAASDSRSGAVNGGRSDQGNVTLDGVDDNDQVGGYAFTGVLRETQDSIEEFRVTTSSANADEGRSSGAQVSMVTKSGTNRYHGAAYEYNRPTITVANDWFNKQAEANSDLQNRPGKLIRNIFGGDAGGFIKKDKLFFFGNYEGSRLAESKEVTQTVATASYAVGNLNYQDGNGVNQVLDPAQIAKLDAGCKVCNTAAYPNPPGPNPNSLAYFNSMPLANGSTEGDGINEGSYSFASPNPVRQNTTIGRIDYVPSDRHRIFVRGNLQKDVGSATSSTPTTEQFPGQGPQNIFEDNTKGITAGETWTIRSNLINDVRYGYIRQGFSNRGVGTGDYVDFRFLSTSTAETRTTINSVPVNNIVDNFNWTKGKHSIAVGGNWRLVHQNNASNANSFDGASTNPYWLGGLAPSPSDLGTGFGNSYLIAYTNLVGAIPSVTDQYNYQITSASSASLLGDGAPLVRHFKANEFEYYLQDAWRVRPNLTVTFGMRHSLLQTPYETTGQQSLLPWIRTAGIWRAKPPPCRVRSMSPTCSFSPPDRTTAPPATTPNPKTTSRLVWPSHFLPIQKPPFAPGPASSTITSASRWSTTSISMGPSASAALSPTPRRSIRLRPRRATPAAPRFRSTTVSALPPNRSPISLRISTRSSPPVSTAG